MRRIIRLSFVLAGSLIVLIGVLLFLSWKSFRADANLLQAASDGDVNLLREEIARNPTIVKTCGNGYHTLLHEACWHGQSDVIRLLLQSGADPNARDWHGDTPLMYAISGESTEERKLFCINLLIEAKADILLQNIEGTGDALSDAINPPKPRLAARLLEAGFPVNRQLHGYTPLHDTCSSIDKDTYIKHIEIIKMLLDRKAEPNAKDKTGRTPLHFACSHVDKLPDTGCMDVICLLLRHGANPRIKDNDGSTPIDIIKRGNKGYLIKLFK